MPVSCWQLEPDIGPLFAMQPVVLVQTDQCFEEERIKSFVADKGCCPITGEELLQSKLKRHRKMEGRIHAWRQVCLPQLQAVGLSRQA